MTLQKNQIIPLTIEGLTGEGAGVGHYLGQAVFVPSSAPGDELMVRIVKPLKRYAYGIVQQIVSPAACRIRPDCPVCAPCGGCCWRHITYQAECAAKRQTVVDAFLRLGEMPAPPVESILPSPLQDRYRNKVQYPVGAGPDGHFVFGFYAGRSHRIVPCGDCMLQPEQLNRIAASACRVLQELGVTPYNEARHEGLVRHIFLRQGWHSGEIMLCLVINGSALPRAQAFCSQMLALHPRITTIVCNLNRARTNVITGPEDIIYHGSGLIRDTLCGVPVALGPHSFYQVNTPAAERLYRTAAEMAALRPTDLLLDLYCGAGTIGLSMARQTKQLIGVEIVPQAIDAARRAAAEMGVDNARFLCADAGPAAAQLAQEGLSPDVIVLDPPRKGCSAAALDAVLSMLPRTVVMVSCNPATAARDVRYLTQSGRYHVARIVPVDLFPRTKHIESCCLLHRGPDH